MTERADTSDTIHTTITEGRVTDLTEFDGTGGRYDIWVTDPAGTVVVLDEQPDNREWEWIGPTPTIFMGWAHHLGQEFLVFHSMNPEDWAPYVLVPESDLTGEEGSYLVRPRSEQVSAQPCHSVLGDSTASA